MESGNALPNGPTCKPLKYKEVPRAVYVTLMANDNDPLKHYMDDTPDSRRSNNRDLRTRTALYLMFTDAVRRHEAWAVDGGDSVIMYTSAPDLLPRFRRVMNSFVRKTIDHFLRLLRKPMLTRQQIMRRQKVDQKVTVATEEAIGSRAKELFYVSGLSTRPGKQRRGYASALVKLVTSLADEQCRGVWLYTNKRTTGFYAQFGFTTIKSFAVGEDDPTWTEVPVVMCIMLREPQTPPSVYKD
ncbi:uncharacterized protein LAESUDRAFT_137040 [Laetiporus sulphureus 93-53]|uniref:N-acetyltransferase domain-containing protein n=1 Tax=Laetiporus sulphureus 93-53 TaxID=1314785 RepID=A0A165ED85_9APHY|nr:uncharacterized protein LAESUDRAFT_137040 [Laetiporus sulphureus 93-53]KZT06783.1 hypothetical protein LAESUDRAFT_137040 [Laetiporus sulphureus 93-53]